MTTWVRIDKSLLAEGISPLGLKLRDGETYATLGMDEFETPQGLGFRQRRECVGFRLCRKVEFLRALFRSSSTPWTHVTDAGV